MERSNTHACACRAGASPRAPRAVLWPALAALLLPKCPLCAAAYLSLLGVGAAVVPQLASALVALRTCSIALACVMLGAYARAIWSQRLRGGPSRRRETWRHTLER